MGESKASLTERKTSPRNQNQTVVPVWLPREGRSQPWRVPIALVSGPDITSEMIFLTDIRASCVGFALNCHSTKKLKSNFPLKSWGFFPFI